MDAGFVDPKTQQSASSLSRFLGVSLRPWSGQSPHSLILRGAVSIALCIFFIWLALQFGTNEAIAEVAPDLGFHFWMRLIFAILIILAATGALRVVVGILDLVPRRSVTGTLVSVRERQFLDFLPRFALEMVFNRGGNHAGVEQRRRRTEVVLATPHGQRQWTVRNSRLRRQLRQLRRGAHIRLTVTPLAGYVAALDELTN